VTQCHVPKCPSTVCLSLLRECFVSSHNLLFNIIWCNHISLITIITDKANDDDVGVVWWRHISYRGGSRHQRVMMTILHHSVPSQSSTMTSSAPTGTGSRPRRWRHVVLSRGVETFCRVITAATAWPNIHEMMMMMMIQRLANRTYMYLYKLHRRRVRAPATTSCDLINSGTSNLNLGGNDAFRVIGNVGRKQKHGNSYYNKF